MTFKEAIRPPRNMDSAEKKGKAFGIEYFHPLCIKCSRKKDCTMKDMAVAKCNFFKCE